MRRIRFYCLLLVLLFTGAGVWAETVFSIGPTITYGYADIHEYVFTYFNQKQRKLSELDWDVHNSFSLGGEMLIDSRYFGFKARYNQVRSVGPGVMEDFDWTNAAQPDHITNYSQHPNEILEKKNLLLEATVPFIRRRLNVSVLTGFQYLYTEMEARDGWRKYESENWNIIRMKGKGISYTQKLELLWLGIDGKYQINPQWKVSLNFAVSPLIFGDCYDLHWKRIDPTDQDQFYWHDVPRYGLGYKAEAGCTYSPGKRSEFALTCSFLTIPELVGNEYRYWYSKQDFDPVPLTATLCGTGYLGWDVSFSYRIRMF